MGAPEEPPTGQKQPVHVSDDPVASSSPAAVPSIPVPSEDGHELSENTNGQPSEETASDKPTAQHTWQFYIIFTGLVLSGLLSALDGAIVSTALPTIVSELDIGADYVWVANIYFLTRYDGKSGLPPQNPKYERARLTTFPIYQRRFPAPLRSTLRHLGPPLGLPRHRRHLHPRQRTLRRSYIGKHADRSPWCARYWRRRYQHDHRSPDL